MKRLSLILLCFVAVMASAQTNISGTTNVSGAGQFGNGSDFSISVSPSNLSVNAGSAVTSTVTVTSIRSFNGAVSLSVSSGPVGTSYGFSPNPITPAAGGTATSTITVTTAVSAPGTSCPGSGSFVITGVSGTITHQVSACVAITASQPFTLQITLVPTTGGAGGNVTVNTGSLSCTGLGICSATYTAGTVVVITEHPTGGTFVGWNGACTGSATTCTVTMNSNVSVQAIFTTQILTYNARTDACVFNNTGSPATGELLASACSGNAACLQNACSGGSRGTQGAALGYTGGLTSVPPAAGTVVSGTNIYGMNSYLVGAGTQMTDLDFGTSILRATDAVQQNSVNCLGSGKWGVAFNGIGAGTSQVWAADDSAIKIQTTGGSTSILAFYPDLSAGSNVGVVAPSSLCGGYFPGAASFSGTDPHIIYTANADQENTVAISSSSGTFITPEQVTNGTAKTQILAVDASFVQVGVVTGTTSGNVWTAAAPPAGSGATFTAVTNPPIGASNTPYQNTIYQGTKCDGVTSDPDESVCAKNPTAGCLANDTNPLCWYVYWTMLFEFNYVPTMTSDPHFPTGDHCLPQNFNANYTGVFAPSTDSTSFTLVWGDNGQNNNTGYNGGGSGKGYVCPNSPQGICQGPVYAANYTVGSGCRVFNTMTDTISGDWGPGSPGPTQVVDQQTFDIPGTLSTSPAPVLGDVWTQGTTGAKTQLICTSAATAGSCAQLTGNGAYVGLIWGGSASSCTNSGADATHVWTDTNGGTLTPSGCPVNAPFLYPDVMHDMTQSPNNALATFSLVQTADMHVSNVAYNATTHQTTVLFNNNTVYSPGQQFNFNTLTGAHDAYLNCTSAAHCPVLTAVAIPNTGNAICPGNGPYCASGSQGTITVTDTFGGGSNYSDAETAATARMTPHPQDENSANGGFGGLNFWQPRTLLVAADLRATGHKAAGDHTVYQGKFYTVINQATPWTPVTVAHVAGPAACNVAGSPCGDAYTGALTPPPSADNVNLIPYSIFGDQHGDANSHGTSDQAPPSLATTNVCGQGGGGGVGQFPCPTQYLAVWNSEIIAAQNAALQSSPGNPIGMDGSYDSSGIAEPEVYRLMNTFNTNGAWALTAQNAEGGLSSDGIFYVLPSDWNLTTGCMDGTTTNCWSSWEATAQNASGTAVTWTTDSASPPNVTITMANEFCPTGGTQYYCATGTSGSSCGTGKTIQSISCGTRAGTVGLSGFTESWLKNQTLTLGPNTANNWGCDSTTSNAGNCTSFVLSNVVGAPASSSGTESGTQTVTPTKCANGVPCQRSDIFIGKVTTAHQ